MVEQSYRSREVAKNKEIEKRLVVACTKNTLFTHSPSAGGNFTSHRKKIWGFRVKPWIYYYFVSFDIRLARAYAIGISIIARAIAKAHEILATTLVTPANVANIAPAPIIRKML